MKIESCACMTSEGTISNSSPGPPVAVRGRENKDDTDAWRQMQWEEHHERLHLSRE